MLVGRGFRFLDIGSFCRVGLCRVYLVLFLIGGYFGDIRRLWDCRIFLCFFLYICIRMYTYIYT